MSEQYNIRVTKIENGYEAVVESPALHVEASTLDGVLLAIERALMDADQQAQAAARAS